MIVCPRPSTRAFFCFYVATHSTHRTVLGTIDSSLPLRMLTADFLKASFDRALSYDAYVATGSPDQVQAWARVHARVTLTVAQRTLISSFTRRLHVLVSSGIWCGDCSAQCPMLDHIAKANPASIALRFVDRDAHRDLADQIKVCGGHRVPTVLFLSEDFEFCGLSTDKSLSRLRALAAKSLGAACPLPGAESSADEISATTADWVADFEKAHLLVRLSPKLRQRHAD